MDIDTEGIDRTAGLTSASFIFGHRPKTPSFYLQQQPGSKEFAPVLFAFTNWSSVWFSPAAQPAQEQTMLPQQPFAQHHFIILGERSVFKSQKM